MAPSKVSNCIVTVSSDIKVGEMSDEEFIKMNIKIINKFKPGY
jgi:hypothetical protein